MWVKPPARPWAFQHGNPETLSIFALVKISTLSNQWEYPLFRTYSDEQVKVMQDSVNGVLLKLSPLLDAHEAILSKLFDEDMNHPSEASF
jgi:hypothetical protein